MRKSIGVLGAGTWGIALARLLANKGYDVTVWSHNENAVLNLNKTHIHPNFKDIVLPDSLRFTFEIKDACLNKDMVVFAVPSVCIRETARKAKDYISDNQLIVDVSKGIEKETLMTLSEVIFDEVKKPNIKLVCLSGPTHAEEVIKDMPTAIVSASKDEESAKLVQEIFSNSFFRVYTNSDIRGTEICGALKNIIALAAGMSDGLGFGDNAKAALITRGLQEIKRLGFKLGCTNETFSGLAGVGDLIVTCTSKHSRNNKCGYLIGSGVNPNDAVKEIGMVVEGINALPAALELSKENNVEMPIAYTVNEIIYNGLSPREAVSRLFARELKNEAI